MRRLPLLLAAFLLALPAAGLGASPARADGEPAGVRQAQAELLRRLHELAGWCTARKLFGARYDLYELIVELAPDDPTARKSNGYTQEGGAWSPHGRKRPGNLSASGLPALRKLQAEIAAWYQEAVAEAAAGLPPGDVAAWRGRALGLAVRVAPEDEELRARHGEVRAKDGQGHVQWLLAESVASRTRRPALVAATEAARTAVAAPTPIEAGADDRHGTVTWPRGFASGRGRIFGLPEEQEVRQSLVNAETSYGVFAEAFGLAAPGPRRYTIYDFDQISKGNVFMAGRDGVTESWLRFVTPLIACWMPKSNAVVVKSPDPETRLEAAPRQVLGAQVAAAVGLSSKQGWAIEGFELYLVWRITGTRLINSVRQSQYGEQQEQVNLAKKLRERDTDWMAEARALVEGRFAPDLRLLLGKTVNTLTPEDILYSYVFAIFLLEGHRDALPGFLRAIAEVKEAGYDGVFGEHLGCDVAGVQERVRRWLQETADLPM